MTAPVVAPPLARVCRVEVSGAWVGWPERDAALARFGALLMHCWLAWELPAVPALTWAEAAPALVDASCARLRFGDADRGLFVRLPAFDGAGVESVASALYEGALAGRGAWLDDQMLRRLGVPPGDAARVREGARNGVAPRRFIGALAEGGDGSALRLRLQMADPTACDGQPGDTEPWAELTEILADAMFYESGMLLPALELEADDSLPPRAMRVWINDLPLPPLPGLPAGRVMVNEGPEYWTQLGFAGAEAIRNPAEGTRAATLPAEALARLRALGRTTWGPGGFALLAVVEAARRHAPALWSATATEASLLRLGDGSAAVVAAWRARFPLPLLGDVLRALLAERVSIRNLRLILETMLAVGSVAAADLLEQIVFAPLSGGVITVDARRPGAPQALDALTVDDWVSQVRIALARQITHQHTHGGSTIVVWLLEREIERQLRDQPEAFETAEGHARLFAAVHAEIGKRSSTGEAPVLLTSKSVRPQLQRLLSPELPELVVLAYEELTPQTSVVPLGRIALSSPGT